MWLDGFQDSPEFGGWRTRGILGGVEGFTSMQFDCADFSNIKSEVRDFGSKNKDMECFVSLRKVGLLNQTTPN